MKKIIFVAVVAAIALVACKKSKMDDEQYSMQKGLADEFIRQPYTYLQNKYIDLVLAYEFKKQDQKYYPEKFSLEEKLEIILHLDSLMREGILKETVGDSDFHENLQRGLMDDINKHPYIQKFASRFAIKDNYDENDMMIYTGYSDCDDAISKFQILKYYEDGIDIIAHYSKRNNLAGYEEWSYYPIEIIGSDENPAPKGVRYMLHLKWGKTIEYMWNTSSSTVRINTLLAMADWRAAANNKISFSEITKNVGWNKTCWIMGWKYFLRISLLSSNNFPGRATLGRVPWAIMDFTSTASYPRTYRHELGHVLGLYHEHQRRDRDDHIVYHSSNVESGAGSNFSKMTAGSFNYYGSAFDFNSIMMYSSWAFTKNGNATLTRKDGTTWERPSAISVTDRNVIRQIYN